MIVDLTSRAYSNTVKAKMKMENVIREHLILGIAVSFKGFKTKR